MQAQTMRRVNSWEMKEKLMEIPGKVLHVVKGNNLIRFQIDSSGKLIYEKFEQAQGAARRSWRKAVTGDPDKRIREYMNELPQVKLVDKLSFLFGVACLLVTEFIALRFPQYFPQYFCTLMTVLVTLRYFQYIEEKFQFFLFDFCYFMNVSVGVQLTLFPDNITWFKANYVLCMGVLMLAIVVWQNSLVFHSLDKLTSIMIHAMPGLSLHLYRWNMIPSKIPADDELSLYDVIVWPFILYSIWQIGYLVITEQIYAYRFVEDPELTTSLRYLARDSKNGMQQLVSKITLSLGLVTKDEEFNPDHLKTKVIFIISQLLYTMATLVVTPFIYANYYVGFTYMIGIYVWCIWRGATYYIEIFSERYHLKFIQTNGGSSSGSMAGDTGNRDRLDSEGSEGEMDHTLINEVISALQSTENQADETE